ncbi:MAG: carbon-nitrogen hydrolase family protein [Lachnospiraceae bacterium]|jgi:omega-amidase|nr:carbon-nitrogen hydrolase family protein [Lachnospiraceae bacterium]
MNSSVLTIAQLQLPVWPDQAKTLAHMSEAVSQAAAQGADLIALPEMFCCPYEVQSFPLHAEKEGGAIWQLCADLARRHQIYLSAGSMPELGCEGQIYNTAYVFDRNGRQIAKHRKMHLFDINIKGGQCFQESLTLTPGNAVTTFDTEFGPMGLCICYDFRFPELARLMTLQGARLLLVPAAFNMTTGPAHWELTFRSQALSNQIYAVGTAPSRDLSASYHSWGHSIIADPWGSVVSMLDEKEAMQLTRLDLSYTDQVREQLPLLRHRRTDLYSLHTHALQPAQPHSVQPGL